MKIWYVAKIKYQKQTDEGLLKLVTESYLVDAVSFTEAEARIIEVMAPEISGEILVDSIAKATYTEILNYEDSDKWFKGRVTYISVDGDGGKEKKVSTYFLVSANTTKEAYERIDDSLSSMLVPFEVPSVSLTNIIEVFPYNSEEESLAEEKKESDKYFEKKEDEKEA
tara:strand:- start:1852 stop:2355 length:504 start_codon:yes stop_codon:yes gene_type:complete